MSFRKSAVVGLVLLVTGLAADADQDFSTMLRWRNIGPFRGGRVRAVCGVPSQPNIFYFAQVNGGVFKTTDYGRTWQPIFDDQPTGSAGAIAVAVSDPNIIYVGSGEGLQRPDLSVGDGIYRSTDVGKTWTHLGLRDDCLKLAGLVNCKFPPMAITPSNITAVLATESFGHEMRLRRILHVKKEIGGAGIGGRSRMRQCPESSVRGHNMNLPPDPRPMPEWASWASATGNRNR